MSYAETAAEYTRALRGFPAPNLPLSALAEERRDTLNPMRIAANHAAHVRDLAYALREALSEDAQGKPLRAYTIALEDAARALLAAIGEGEA